MKIEEVTTNKQLIEFIQLEIIQQTIIRKRINIYLPELWFFKLIKLIQFYIKYDKSEPYRDMEIPQETKEFRVLINGYQTKVFKK